MNYQKFYLKLKKYNLSKKYLEKYLKQLFFRGLSSKDILKIFMDELQVLTLDKIVKKLNSKQ